MPKEQVQQLASTAESLEEMGDLAEHQDAAAHIAVADCSLRELPLKRTGSGRLLASTKKSKDTQKRYCWWRCGWCCFLGLQHTAHILLLRKQNDACF